MDKDWTQVSWACDEPECFAEFEHFVRSWTQARRSAEMHHKRTGHTTIVLRQEGLRFE